MTRRPTPSACRWAWAARSASWPPAPKPRPTCAPPSPATPPSCRAAACAWGLITTRAAKTSRPRPTRPAAAWAWRRQRHHRQRQEPGQCAGLGGRQYVHGRRQRCGHRRRPVGQHRQRHRRRHSRSVPVLGIGGVVANASTGGTTGAVSGADVTGASYTVLAHALTRTPTAAPKQRPAASPVASPAPVAPAA